MTQKYRSGHAAPKTGSPCWLPTALGLTSKSPIMMSSPWRSDLYHLSSLTFLHPIPPHILQQDFWKLLTQWALPFGAFTYATLYTRNNLPPILHLPLQSPFQPPPPPRNLLFSPPATQSVTSPSSITEKRAQITSLIALVILHYLQLIICLFGQAFNQLQVANSSQEPCHIPPSEYPELCLVHSRCSVNSSKMNQCISKWRKYWTVRNIALSTLFSHFKTCQKCLLSQVTLF